MKNKNNNGKEFIPMIGFVIFVVIMFTLSNLDQFDIAFGLFMFVWICGLVFIVAQNIHKKSMMNKNNDKMKSESSEEDSSDNNYDKDLDDKLDNISQELKNDSTLNNSDGVIKDKYVDLNSKGETTYIVEVYDTLRRDTFSTAVSQKSYSMLYVGKKIKIKRGLKRHI